MMKMSTAIRLAIAFIITVVATLIMSIGEQFDLFIFTTNSTIPSNNVTALIIDLPSLSQPHQLMAGPEFDGHGGLSAGGSSRLLQDYSEPYRNEILDYLFLPGFGASLGVLKLEIGGDTQSTVGTEPSHWHSRRDKDRYEPNLCRHGYEGWLAWEARRRNPHIKIWSLSWGVPGWITSTSNGTETDTDQNYFSDDNIDYQIAWLECLRDVYNVTSDYLGLWNERSQGSVDYVLKLRQQLDERGFPDVGITLEATWQRLVDYVLDTTQPSFNRSIAAVTIHYPCNSMNNTNNQCQPALKAHKKIWAGEDTPTPYSNWTAASCWGRKLSHHFLNFQMTSVVSWALVWSVWEGMSNPIPTVNDTTHHFRGIAFLTANEPWSGHYTIPPTIWINAHWGQFIPHGWRYLPRGHGSDFLIWSDDTERRNAEDPARRGSYITLVPPRYTDRRNDEDQDSSTTTSTTQFTMIVETLQGRCGVAESSCDVPPRMNEIQKWVFRTYTDSAPRSETTMVMPKVLNVWCSNSTDVFVKQPALLLNCSESVIDNNHTNTYAETCSFAIDMYPDSICTITTLSSMGYKGQHPQPPRSTAFSTPYQDDFDSTSTNSCCNHHHDGDDRMIAWGFSDVYGSFAIRNHSLTQMATAQPIGWAPINLDPLTLIGDIQWGTIHHVRVNVLVNHTAHHHYTRVCGGCANVSNRRILFDCPSSCCFNLTWNGEWSIGPNYHGRLGNNHDSTYDEDVADHHHDDNVHIERDKRPFIPLTGDDDDDDVWHSVQLSISSTGTVTVLVDNATVIRTADGTCVNPGMMVGLGCGSYHMCAFRNFSVHASRNDGNKSSKKVVLVG